MYKISEQQIDYILHDIGARGVEMEDLQLNLLDHICCIIEKELEASGDFEQFYAATIRKFYKGELREIEDETISLLTNKNYYVMKKVMIFSGLFSAAVFIMGIVLKFMHAPGASFGIVVGITTMSLIFLPLMFLLKAKEQQKSKDKLLMGLGTLSAILMSLSILFLVMHWPGALYLGYATVGILGLLFLPIYVTNGIRRPETKVNTIVTSVMLVGVCCLWLTLVVSPAGDKLNLIKETNLFVRNQQIVQTEQNQLERSIKGDSLALTSLVMSRKINKACEEMKAYILERSTGQSSIDADFMAKGTLIKNKWMAGYFAEGSDAKNKLEWLKNMVVEYNKANNNSTDHYFHKIPVTQTILDMSEEKVIGALNSLTQIQMRVLQNERELVAMK